MIKKVNVFSNKLMKISKFDEMTIINLSKVFIYRFIEKTFFL